MHTHFGCKRIVEQSKCHLLVFVLPLFFISFIFVLVRLHYSVGFFRSHNILLLLLLLLFFVSRSCSCLYSSFFYHVLFCLTSVHICVYLFGFLTNMFLLLPAIVAHINCVDLDTPSLKRHWRLNRTISLTEQPLRGGCTFYDQTKKRTSFHLVYVANEKRILIILKKKKKNFCFSFSTNLSEHLNSNLFTWIQLCVT